MFLRGWVIWLYFPGASTLSETQSCPRIGGARRTRGDRVRGVGVRRKEHKQGFGPKEGTRSPCTERHFRPHRLNLDSTATRPHLFSLITQAPRGMLRAVAGTPL